MKLTASSQALSTKKKFRPQKVKSVIIWKQESKLKHKIDSNTMAFQLLP